MTLMTDMNARERERFAKSFDLLAERATQVASHLRTAEDEQILIPVMMISLTTPSMLVELLDILQKGQRINTNDLDLLLEKPPPMPADPPTEDDDA